LPGVSEEVRALRELLPNASFLTREQATKAALQSVIAPSILHIATHGFFLSEPGAGTATGSPGTTRGINANAKIENRCCGRDSRLPEPIARMKAGY